MERKKNYSSHNKNTDKVPESGHMGRGPKLKGAKARKPKDFKASLIKLMTFLKPYYFKLIIVLIFSIGSTVFFIADLRFLQMLQHLYLKV